MPTLPDLLVAVFLVMKKKMLDSCLYHIFIRCIFLAAKSDPYRQSSISAFDVGSNTHRSLPEDNQRF